ncbi:hypothetical protein [Marinomonas balearica]|uniref:Late embryogenesis abundant protein n=1 Tax=Marinomonas balearica TaxID=491947 RepID=A0A4R6M621_9GAMM|nr:hypothetical protein [Marinomonas balearica]TDO96773.1 hypothetical protein DFP79_2541 [Marinomonas balearica]
MKKLIMASLLFSGFVTIPAVAEEGAVDSVKESVVEFGSSAMDSGKEVLGKASDKAAEVGSDVADKAKEVGSSIWDGVKEASHAAAGYVEEGASKVKDMTESDEATESTESKADCETSFFNSCEKN